MKPSADLFRLVVLAAVVTWLVTVLVALTVRIDASAVSGPGSVRGGPGPVGGVRAHVEEPHIGFALGLHGRDNGDRYRAALVDLRRAGSRSVLLAVPYYQPHAASPGPAPHPRRTPTRIELESILAAAGRQGLRIGLMPVVLLDEPRSGEWRGRIRPPDWDAWWSAYERCVLDLADLAAVHRPDLFVIGSELNSAESMTARWTDLAETLRGRLPETDLAYSANWDRYTGLGFVDSLDVLGVSAWHRLAAGPASSVDDERLRTRWAEIRDGLLAFAERIERPILLTEVGYPTVPWALSDPWNYVPAADTGPPDPGPQARGYQALFAAWEPVFRSSDPRFAGLFCWEWDPHRAGGPDDYGYGVRGKPAAEVVRRGFARLGSRPGSSPPRADLSSP